MLADYVARLVAGVGPDPWPGRARQARNAPGRRGKASPGGVFGVDAGLDGVAVPRHVVLRKGQRLAPGDQELEGHQVQAGDHFRYRVLDLQTGVHFEEIELAVLVNELHRPRVDVPARQGETDGGLAHGVGDRTSQAGGGRLFHQFLVASLHGAVARAEMDHVAVVVAEDLYLDVARPGQVFLQVALGPSKSPLRFPLRRLQCLGRLGGRGYDPHSAAAAAERRLDRHRPPEGVPELDDLARPAQSVVGAGDGRDAGPDGGGTAADLVAHGLDGVGRRAYPAHPRTGHGPGEVSVLGQEAVAGVDGVGPAAGDGVEEALDREVAFRRLGAAYEVGLVRGPDVPGTAVRFRVHRHRRDTEIPAGAGHPHGDLAPVGDQDLGDGSSPHDGAVCQAGAMSVDSCMLNDAQLGRLAHTRFATLAQLGETASTNSVLVAHAQAGAPEGLVVVAGNQSAGRGRFQRRWESRPGGSLLFSVLLRPRLQDLPPQRRHLAVAAVALALVEGAKTATAAELRLKWPNDIVGSGPVQDEAKVAGILAESPDGAALVVGAGMNISWAPEGMGATCLTALGPGGRGPVDRAEVLVESLLALDGLYGRWDLVGHLYRQSCATIGREVSVTLAEGVAPVVGTAVTTDDDGHLVVRTGTGPDGREVLVTVAAGDVTHVRPASPPGPSAPCPSLPS